MSISLALAASQLADGAPISIRVTDSYALPDTFSDSFVCYGVTTTSTPPATVADFAHKTGGTTTYNADPTFLSMSETDTNQSSGGVAVRTNGTATLQAYQAVDSNYVAGRYLWAASAMSALTGSLALAHVAGPYLIH